MSELELLVAELLEEQVPLRLEAQPDWTEVLARAGVERAGDLGRASVPLRRRRALVAAAAVAAVFVLAAATPLGSAVAGLGRAAFDGLSAWIHGEPGAPASPAEQAGFAARNNSSYAAFPASTRLRRLTSVRAAGRAFTLLGFRSGSSLCLRLVRSDLPAARGELQCVTLRELRSSRAPALVASDARFQVGVPAQNVDGVFGFADDTVRGVQLRRLREGWRTVPVESNVFLALRARPAGSVKNHPPFDPVVQVRALTRDGRRLAVPYIAPDMGNYGQGLPSGPSYLGRGGPTLAQLPGPARVQRRFAGGTIGWLERREPRGSAWVPAPRTLSRLGSLVFARAVQPDSASPLRIGLFLVRVRANAGFPTMKPGSVVLCESELAPLQRGPTGAACGTSVAGGLFAAGQPLMVSYMGPTQITAISGIAADQVAAVDLYLASGRVVPAALKDNALSVVAPTSQLPGKLVAYDARHRVIGIQLIGGYARPTPCPRAVFAKPLAALPAPRPYERLDLGALTVNGAAIFGRSPAAVEAALGRPERIRAMSRTNGHPESTFFYGGTTQATAALQVQFGWRQQRLRAIALQYQSPSLVDARLGHILRLQPAELKRRIAAAYGARLRLDLGYGSVPARGCSGDFVSKNKAVQVSFGIDPYRPSRPFLWLRHGY